MEIANSKIANDWFYNGDAKGGVPADTKGLSQDQITALISAGAQIVGGVIQNRAAMNAASGCDRPLLGRSVVPDKWKAYDKCIAAAGVVPPPATTTTPPPEKEKFFSTTAGKATIGGVIGIVLILGAVIAYKKFKK